MRVLAKVERILQTNPKARNSDKELILAVWCDIEGLGLSDSQKRIFMDRCTTPESLTRARRLVKEKYPADEKIDERRYELFKMHQSKMWDEVM